MLKTYVEFLLPGSFFPETMTREVADRSDPSDIPQNTYGYQLYSRTEVAADGEVLHGPERDRSGTTYFGVRMTAEDIGRLPGDHKILLSNMRINDWPEVVRTVMGNFRPLRTGDRVIAVMEVR
jgi:hypothetical protein